MLFCSTEWRRVVSHGRKPIRMTQSGKLMLKGPPLNSKYLVVVKKLVPKMHLCLVGTFTMIAKNIKSYLNCFEAEKKADKHTYSVLNEICSLKLG